METEGSLLCLQESANCPYPTLDKLILRHPILGLPRGLLPLVFPTKALYTFPFIPPNVTHASLISYFFIWLPLLHHSTTSSVLSYSCPSYESVRGGGSYDSIHS